MPKDTIIAFPQKEETENIYEMTRSELQTHYAAMQRELRALDEKEPENMLSDCYEAWAEEHEELEDYLDEILERMEALEG